MDHVQQALGVMYTPASSQDQKKEATNYLESFQKTPDAWQVAHQILSDPGAPAESRMFASQTLRSKATYDLLQLSAESLLQLRGSMLELLSVYSVKDKLIRVQLSLCLCQLALQDLEWKNAVNDITSRLTTSDQSVPALLEFLRILPEELTLSNKTPLTDEQFLARTQELIADNALNVLVLLKNMADSGTHTALLLDCLNSWIKECSIVDVLSVDALAQVMFQSLTDDNLFESAVECLCSVFKETRDIDNYQLIDALYQQLLNFHETFAKNPQRLEDLEIVSGLTRLYAEAGESWHVLIAKNPVHFKPLVQIILQCCKYDQDLDVVKYTFYFWYQLKQMLTLSKLESSRDELLPIYLELIQVILYHLRYPLAADDNDLFDGDKEAEDKFKEFRYEMGDVLKDCCAVVGPQRSLNVPFQQIQELLNRQSAPWQYLEAPLFGMRVMAKEVSKKEKAILPAIMRMLVRLPEHPRIRYATTLVLGRYSEWTAQNPEFLQPQLSYIVKGFQGDVASSQDIVKATSQALMYSCQDCAPLLIEHMDQLYMLYKQVQTQLGTNSVYDLVDGLSHVIREIPAEKQYMACESFLGPTIDRISNLATSDPNDDISTSQLRDEAEILSIFHDIVRCYDYTVPANPVASFFMDRTWPLIPAVLSKFGKTLNMSELCVRIVKNAFQGLTKYLAPIIDDISTLLHEGFKSTLYGCYLWATGVIIQSSEELPDNLSTIYRLALSQCNVFFQLLAKDSNIDIKGMPDVIEDFFNMAGELLMYFPAEVTFSEELIRSIFEAGIIALDVSEEYNPLMSCVHFFIDYVSWGSDDLPVSLFEGDFESVRLNVRLFVSVDSHLERLLKAVLSGLIYKFYNDSDGNDLVIKILIVPPDVNKSISRLNTAVLALPNVSEQEVNKLMGVVSVALPSKDIRRIRIAIRDFVSWYTRKNVNSRAAFY